MRGCPSEADTAAAVRGRAEHDLKRQRAVDALEAHVRAAAGEALEQALQVLLALRIAEAGLELATALVRQALHARDGLRPADAAVALTAAALRAHRARLSERLARDAAAVGGARAGAAA